MRRRAPAAWLAAAVAATIACARALHEPAPLAKPSAEAARTGEEALLARAEEAWKRRAEPEEARKAQELFVEAASADEHRVAGLLGAMRAASFRIAREKDKGAREKLAVQAVELGQWCERRAPNDARCAYRLAIALGEQARERTSTAKDALGRMVKLLHEAIAADPRMDQGGPHRVLGLLLLKAPGWPVGPGDPEEALKEVRAAAALFPESADNQLALAEALAKNGHQDEARAAYERAAALSEKEIAAGDPDGVRLREEALAGARGDRT